MAKENINYVLTVTGNDGLTIQFNSDKPEELIADRSLFGITDKKLIEEIKAKPFMLVRNLHVCIEQDDEKYEFVIPRGFCYDGASIPAFAWIFIGQKTEPRLKLASCVHDYLCEHHVLVGNNRRLSTNVFITLCEVFGKFNKLKRCLMYSAINVFQRLFCGWGK